MKSNQSFRKNISLILSFILLLTATGCSLKINPPGIESSSAPQTETAGESTEEGGSEAAGESSETVSESSLLYEMPSFPEVTVNASEFYEENATVMTVEDAEKSDGPLSEQEAVQLLTERGFGNERITYDIAIDGTYVGETEASADSGEKHPYYFTTYIAEGGILWEIFIIGRELIANPVVYNAEAGDRADVVAAETDHLTSYDEEMNQLYVTIPKESEIKIKTIDRINADALDEITAEEMDSL